MADTLEALLIRHRGSVQQIGGVWHAIVRKNANGESHAGRGKTPSEALRRAIEESENNPR